MCGLTTHADGSCGFFLSVCLFSARHLKNRCILVMILELDAASSSRIIKLDTEMFHHEFWKPIYLGSKVRATRHKKQCRRGFWHSCACWLPLVYTCRQVYDCMVSVSTTCVVSSVCTSVGCVHVCVRAYDNARLWSCCDSQCLRRLLLRLSVRCRSLPSVAEEDENEADVTVTVSEPDFGDWTSIWSAEESVTEEVVEPCSNQDGLLERSSESDDDLSPVSSFDDSASSVWYSEPEFRSWKSVWSAEESVTEEVVEPCCSQDSVLERSFESDDDLFYVSSLDDSTSSAWDCDDDDDDDDDDLSVSDVSYCTAYHITDNERVVIVDCIPKC